MFEYVKRRGIQGEETIDTVAMMILGQRIYNPLQIAQMVNDFVQYRRRARRA